MNKNVSFLLSGFVVLVLVTSALGSRAAHGNNMPPPVQGPSVDCNQDPSNSACQNPPPAANNPTITTGCGPGTDNSTCSTSPNPPPTITTGCGPGTDNSTCSPTQPTTPPCSCTSSSCTSPAAFVVDASGSGPPCDPVAVANADPSIVNEGDTITLDGSKSTDSGGGNQLLYHWEQVPTTGPVVDLSDPTAVTPTFTAPKDLSDITKLTFKLVVTDNLDVNDKAYHGNHDSNPATVDVTVCAAKKDPLLRSGEVNIPVPDKETGKCDYSQVDVRATYIGTGYTPFKHLFIVYTDQDGKQTEFRGGPGDPPPPPSGYITSTVEPCQTYAIDCRDLNADSKILLKGVAAHDMNTCFSTLADSIDKAHIPYKNTGPNSNTFVKTLLHICGPWPPSQFNYGAAGILPVDRLRVPGWGDPDLVKCVYSKLDNSCG